MVVIERFALAGIGAKQTGDHVEHGERAGHAKFPNRAKARIAAPAQRADRFGAAIEFREKFAHVIGRLRRRGRLSAKGFQRALIAPIARKLNQAQPRPPIPAPDGPTDQAVRLRETRISR
ncbi:hypothetical protein GCM10011358_10370 [Sinisalibacter lacisalsi]|uniref:Uncharacterized protein n=1 Tax=Sinisalibacter lacisalsi TaxID=1526570 RepID=A0ABQ1QI78_9RHOB|nr:hypothetical protein GCM10011358_10370 [Sinisalibacter lacisalsi]